MKRLLLVLATLLTVTAAQPAMASAGVILSFWERDSSNVVTPDFVGVENDLGIYYIGLYCFREQPTTANVPGTGAPLQTSEWMEDGRNDVGPGYVFESAAKQSPGAPWKRKTRDFIDVSLSDTRSGGWLKFGVHTARNGSSSPAIMEVQGGLCYQKARYSQPDYGSGVSSSRVLYTPYVDINGSAHVGVEVTLARHEWKINPDRTITDSQVVVGTIRYEWTIGSTTLELRTAVKPVCCSIYYKEPKFVLDDYFNDDPYVVGEIACTISPCTPGQQPYVCARTIGDPSPKQTTGKCANYYRHDLWFKYKTTQSINQDCITRCTWALARGTPVGNPASYYWATGTYGLDAWAVDASQQARYGPGTCDAQTFFENLRRWEIGRWTPWSTITVNGVTTPDPSPDRSTTTQVGLHGWTGGTGPTDCQNLLRLAPLGAEYDNYFQVAFR